MNEMKIFQNIEFGKIRIEEIGSNPWFVVKDVCDCLGIINTTDATKRLDADDLDSIYVIDSIGRKQMMHITNESGLYSLILQSRRPEAKRFKKWITSEVLPSIRKNGGYILNQENLTDEEIMARALIVAQNTIKNKNKEIEDMKPDYLLGKSMTGKIGTITVGNFAEVLNTHGRTDIGQNKLFEWLRNNGYLCNIKGNNWNKPTSKSRQLDLFVVKETIIEHNNGFQSISCTPLLTEKGQKYFLKKFVYGGNVNESDR